MFSSTVKAENSAPCWNSMPTRLAAPLAPSTAAGLPSTVTLPREGVCRPRIWRSSTVLPLPEPPTMASTSPCATVRFRSLCTTTSTPAVWNTDHSPLISTTGGRTWAGAAAVGSGAVAGNGVMRQIPMFLKITANSASIRITTVIEVTTEAVVPCPRLSVLGLTRRP